MAIIVKEIRVASENHTLLFFPDLGILVQLFKTPWPITSVEQYQKSLIVRISKCDNL